MRMRMRLHYFIRIIGTGQRLVIFLDEFLAVITGCGGGFLFRYFNRYDMDRFIIVLRNLC